MTNSYNLLLPSKTFPMKRSAETDAKNLEAVTTMAARETGNFLLHDGPPYANGHLHLGHALNKVAKDSILRTSENRYGKMTSYRPGWDCHGLPIELKVDEEYRKLGKNKNDDPVQFRKDCRAYADHWVSVQKEEFRKFGVKAEWDQCYTTHDYGYEAHTLRNLYTLQEKKLLHRKMRPVYWSPAESTTLSDMEVVEAPCSQTLTLLKLKVVGKPYSVVVTDMYSWRFLGMKAVLFDPNMQMVMTTDSDGDSFVDRAQSYASQLSSDKFSTNSTTTPFNVADLEGAYVEVPFASEPVPLVSGSTDHVFPHLTNFSPVVPGHGFEDYDLSIQYGLEAVNLLDNDGNLEVDGKLVPVLDSHQAVSELFERHNIVSKYLPTDAYHAMTSERSKTPVVVKLLENWFFDLDEIRSEVCDRLREMKANESLQTSSMVQNRQEWCLSRQRIWGVPLAFFVHKQTGEVLFDKDVNSHVVDLVSANGCDVWYEKTADELLPEKYRGQYDKVMDVLDVWFDSGSSFKFVYPNANQADLVVEGRDQHRGWFQSSTLLNYAVNGTVPFWNILTHGFVTHSGKKLSKSDGPAFDVMELVDQHGADTVRLWCLQSSLLYDVDFSEETFRNACDSYKKVRNFVKFCVSNLVDQDVDLSSPLDDFDKFALYQVAALWDQYGSVSKPQLQTTLSAISTLSEIYFTSVKETLYCDSKHSVRRKSVVQTFYRMLKTMLIMIESECPFLVAEVAEYGFTPEYMLDGVDLTNLGYWEYAASERNMVMKHFDQVRQTENLQMEQMVVTFESVLPVDWKTVLNCAEYRNEQPSTGEVVKFEVFEGEKCLRCRSYHANVNHEQLCNRCEEVENEFK